MTKINQMNNDNCTLVNDNYNSMRVTDYTSSRQLLNKDNSNDINLSEWARLHCNFKDSDNYNYVESSNQALFFHLYEKYPLNKVYSLEYVQLSLL